MKGNEKDCICANEGKHSKRCDAFRLSEFMKQAASVMTHKEPTLEEKTSEWEKEFEKLDIIIEKPHSIIQEETYEKYKLILPMAWEMFKPSVKSFIRSTLSTHTQDLVQEVEGMKRECTECENREVHDSDPYNKALNDIITLLTKHQSR